MELKFSSSKDPQKDKTLITDLAGVNVHLFTDKTFFDRTDEITVFFDGYLTDEEIAAMHLSDTRKEMLKRTMRIAKLVYRNMPFGKAKENMKFMRAMNAISDFIHANEVTVNSRVSDDDVRVICEARMAKFRNVLPATFDSENTTLNKGIAVQTLPGMGGAGNMNMDQDTKDAILAAQRLANAKPS